MVNAGPMPHSRFGGRTIATSGSNRDSSDEWRDSQNVAKLRLRVNGHAQGTDISLEGFDATGKKILSADFDSGATYAPTDPNSPRVVFGSVHPGTHVLLRPESKEQEAFLKENIDSQPDWFKRPDIKEPLDLLARDALVQLNALKPGKTLVVAVPDGMLPAVYGSVLGMSYSARQKADAAERQFQISEPLFIMQLQSGFECQETEQSIVMRNLDPEGAEQSRADRKELVRFVKRLSTDGRVAIPWGCRFYFDAAPRTAGMAIEWSLEGQRLAGDTPAVTCTLGGDFMHAFGPLADEQWSALSVGKTLTVGGLGIGKALTGNFDKNPS